MVTVDWHGLIIEEYTPIGAADRPQAMLYWPSTYGEGPSIPSHWRGKVIETLWNNDIPDRLRELVEGRVAPSSCRTRRGNGTSTQANFVWTGGPRAMHVCSARTQPLAGTDLYIEPSPWQGSVVPLHVALAATRRDRLLLHEFCRGNKTPYKKSKSVDSWIAILLLLWNCHSASTAITTTVTVTATVTVA